MSMVERVARAAYKATPRNKPFDLLSAFQRERLMLEARASIAAMRNTTQAMSEAMRVANMNIAGGYGGPSGWEAAIDAALSEEEERG